MTNETDLRECSAQIELVKQLLGPETFDLNKVLIELETKKKLLMTFKPRSYHNILEDLESGAIKHPGDWVKPPKEIVKEVEVIKEVDNSETIEMLKTSQENEEKLIETVGILDSEIDSLKKEAKEKAQLEKELQDTKDKLAELEALKEAEKEEETAEEILGE